jgi:hypothetical protein
MALGSRAVPALAALALAGVAHAAVTIEQGKKGLVITGDGASDVVVVNGLGATGAVEVWVNAVLVDSFVGVGDIKVKMGGGDDFLDLAGIHIGGALIIDLGAGDDVLDLDDTPDIGTALDHHVFIPGGIDVKMGGQAGDSVDWDSAVAGVTIGGDVVLAQAADIDLKGSGGSDLAEPVDIHIGGKLKISKHMGMIDLDDVNVGLVTIIELGSSADFVDVTDSRFAGSVSISLGSGDDRLDLGTGTNEFNGPFTAQGGKDNDEFDFDPANVFTFGFGVSGFEVIN